MTEYRAAVEDYPHILSKLSELWGHAEVLAFLDGLVTSDREDVREGFPPDVVSEMFWLFEIHRIVFPDEEQAGLWKHVSIYEEKHD